MFENIFPLLSCTRCKSSIKPFIITIYDASYTGLPPKIIFGTAKCNCSQYPIIQGILYLGQKGRKKAVSLIKNGKFSKSIDAVLDLPQGLSKLVKWIKPWGRVDRGLWPIGLGTTKLFERSNWFLTLMELFPDSRPWATYLKQRRQNPTFANSLTALCLMNKGYCLDVGSGMGHFIPFLEKKAGPAKVVGVDNSFWNLYFSSLSNKFASHIYANAEEGLPFKDKCLANITLNDCFHCFSDKKKVASEINRVLDTRGLAALAHVHNKKTGMNSFGIPLKFAQFQKLFNTFYIHAIPENILHREVVKNKKKIFFKDFIKYQKALLETPSYIAYLFKGRANKGGSVLLPKEYSKMLPVDFNYSEDKWLEKN